MISREQEIQQAFNELPENIKETVEKFDWAKEILAIGHKYGIQIDDIHILQQQTMLIIVGLERAADYKHNLMKHMDIDEELAEALVHESNVRIFEELQRRAFSREQHEGITETMKEEGVHLLHEDEQTEDSVEETEKVTLYHEPLDDDDYTGISGHRINIDALAGSEKIDSQALAKKNQQLEKDLYHTSMLSKGDTVRISKENSDQDKKESFLDQLKNTS